MSEETRKSAEPPKPAKKPASSASGKKRKKKRGQEAPQTTPWWIAGVGAVLLLGFTLWAWNPREAPEAHTARGNELYRGRQFGEALSEYEAAPGNGPRYAGVHMDRGLAQYRVSAPTGDAGGIPLWAPETGVPDGFSAAQEELRTAARGGSTGAAEDVSASLRARAAYNLGNTHFTARQWDPAIDSYKEALRLRPGWREAAWNLELARQLRELDRHPPDAGNPDATPPDANNRDSSPPDSGPPDANDAGDSGPPDSGPPDGGQGDGGHGNDGGRDSGQNDSGQGDSGQGNDSGNPNAGQDGGSNQPDGGGGAQPDGGVTPDGGPPRSLGPLDELDHSSRSLQNELLRRRGLTPRGPDDDRK